MRSLLAAATFYGTITGAIVGSVWGLALGVSIVTTLIIGAIAGVIVGGFMAFIGTAARIGGNINKQESAFVTGSIIGGLGLVLVVAGLVVWIVRVLFW